MAKKDIIGTYGKSFNDTPKGKELSDIIVKIESEIKMEEKLHKEEYKKALALVDPSWSIERKNRAYAEIAKKRCDADSQSYKARVTELVNAKENYANALKSFAEKIEGNEAWNGIRTRKRAFAILNAIASGSYTESELENLVYKKTEVKACELGQRLGFPIKYFNALGWITRDNLGHDATHHITDEGKRQLDFYNQYGMFDSSKVA
jgi:hypothetical protein